MAVVVVGDIDALKVEKLVKQHFGRIPSSDTVRTRPAVIVPRARAPRAAVLTDPEATSMRVALWFPRPVPPRKHVSDYRAQLIGELWRDILDARLQAASEEPGSALLTAGVSHADRVRSLEAEVVSATVVEDKAMVGVRQLAAE